MEWVLFVFSPAITCLVHSPISARGIQQKSLVFLMVGMVWEQKWAQHLYFSRWSVWVETTLYYSKSVLPILMIGPVLREESWRHIQSLSLAYRGGIGVLRVVPATYKGFLEMFTQIWSLSGLAVMHKLAVTNFIWSYLHQFFDYSHGLRASLKPLRRPFDWCQSRLKAINNGWDIKQINW